MTQFLDVRADPVGGTLASSVSVMEGTSLANYQSLSLNQLISDIRGRHVLIGTHGFNNNRADGIQHLSNWEGLLTFAPMPSIFVGVLWPGDSVWAHGLDYPDEPKIADDAATQLLAPFIDANFISAASISFASHSLGARVVLQTVANMSLPVRRAMLMAGAIDDDCLDKEFKAAAEKIGKISVLASKKDEVLSALFPLGNFFAGIIDQGHPWWRGALGRGGPAPPTPGNFVGPFEIPSNWQYGHGNYLQVDVPPLVLGLPQDVPPEGSAPPGACAKGWQEGFSAAFCSTRFQ